MVHSETKIVEWTAPEFLYKERKTDWYWWLGLITIIATVGSIVVANYWLTAFIIIGGILVGAMARHKPEDQLVEISEIGIRVGNEMHAFQDLDAFWVEMGQGKSTPIWAMVIAGLVTLAGGGYAIYEKEWGALIFLLLAFAFILMFIIQKKPKRGVRLLLHSEGRTGLPLDSILINTDQVDPIAIRDLLREVLPEIELKEPFLLRVAHRMGIM